MLSEEGWKGLQEKIQSMPLSKSRGLQRFFFSGATDVETDKQGRILIPQPLRDHAGLTKDVTFVGVSSRVEIWDTGRWNQVNGELIGRKHRRSDGRAGESNPSACPAKFPRGRFPKRKIPSPRKKILIEKGGGRFGLLSSSGIARETIQGLAVKPDGVYVDGTAGGGGHSEAIARELAAGKLISIDQDPDAVETVTQRLAAYGCVTVCRANFSQMAEVVRGLGIGSVDGVLMDIGVSSHQLDTPERGFSYHSDAPLDMRMSQEGPSAKDLVNTLSWQELARIFSQYGEERFSSGSPKTSRRPGSRLPLKPPFSWRRS